MAKAKVYYLGQIKLMYPEMQPLHIKDFEDISEEINEQIQQGKTPVAVQKMYNKMLPYLKYLAKCFVDNGLPAQYFNDAASGLCLYLMDYFDRKAKSGNWFKSYNHFCVAYHTAVQRFVQSFAKENIYSAKLLKRVNNLGSIKSRAHKNVPSAKQPQKVSLESIIDTDEDIDLDAMDNLFSGVAKQELAKIIREQLATLTPREECLLKSYFGLDDGIPKTLRQVAIEQNLGLETVRLSIAKGLRKMRHPHRSKHIKDFTV